MKAPAVQVASYLKLTAAGSLPAKALLTMQYTYAGRWVSRGLGYAFATAQARDP